MKPKFGTIIFITGLLIMFGVAGGVEKLPAEAGLFDWACLMGGAASGIILSLLGIRLYKEQN